MAEDEERTVQALAEERTRLARERTVLAHIRTGFASFLFGIALLGIFDTRLAFYGGTFFILLGALFLVTSGLSYLLSARRLRRLVRPVRHIFEKED